MDRTTLGRILESADGVLTAKGDRYEVAEGHRISFYLGDVGEAMIVRDVATCVNGEHFVTLVHREDSVSLFRPPPGRRTRPGCGPAESNSFSAPWIVTRERPQARLTRLTPP